MWETLIFGTGDWFAFGEPFFCGLFTPTNPLPGHRLVPESHGIQVCLRCLSAASDEVGAFGLLMGSNEEVCATLAQCFLLMSSKRHL